MAGIDPNSTWIGPAPKPRPLIVTVEPGPPVVGVTAMIEGAFEVPPV
jgi:hypothetical protein